VTTVEPETVLCALTVRLGIFVSAALTSTVFYRQAWYHSCACVTISTIFSSIFAPARMIFFSSMIRGPLQKNLKNRIFYRFTYFLRLSKEEIQGYQATQKVSLTMRYWIF
jgi:hypothetical protein